MAHRERCSAPRYGNVTRLFSSIRQIGGGVAQRRAVAE